MKTVKKLPEFRNIKNNTIFELCPNQISYYTHTFFKYPCKFIPLIPKWAITNFSNENDYVIDPIRLYSIINEKVRSFLLLDARPSADYKVNVTFCF